MKVAIIGSGRQGHRRAKALKDCGDELIIAVDVNLALATELRKEYGGKAYTDWRVAIKDKNVDAVIICTPPDTHAAIAIAALGAGKHVLCEKPLARNPAEAQEMLNALKKSKATLKCGFNHRYHPAVMQAKKHVESGAIGKIMFMRCRYGITGRANYDKDWRANPPVSGGGQLMDGGQHALDLFRWFGGDMSEIMGHIDTLYWNIKPEDNAFAILRGKAGHTCIMHVSWTEWRNLFSFEIFGDKGYAKVEGLGGSYGTERLITGERDFEKPFYENITEFKESDKSFHEEWKEFSSKISAKPARIGSAQDGLEAIKLAYSIYESSENKKTVKL